MCFFNAQNKRALAIAKRYGRKSDIIEMAREIIEEQKVQKAFLHPDCYIVTNNEQLLTAKWGLIPFWVREAEKAESIRKMTTNAKVETVFTLPSFREAIRRRRCLIPSTGFYEYHYEGQRQDAVEMYQRHPAVVTKKQDATPYRIFVRDTDIFSMAGVYEEWRHPETKETVRTFSVLTVPANELCAFVHNGGKNAGRMPAIIPLESEETWINPDLKELDIKSLLKPFDSTSMDALALEKDYLRRA